MAITFRTLAYLAAFLIVLSFGIGGSYYLGSRGGFNYKIDTFVNATYFTVVTIGTVGYGDFVPVTPTAKIFVMVLIIAGVTTFLSTLASLAGEFMKERIEVLSGRLSAFEKRLLKKHIILIGGGSTNMYLAEKLREKNERFIIITSDKITAEHLKNQGYRAFLSDATSEADMLEFGFDKAKAVIIDVRDSSRAVYALLVVKEIAKNAKIVVVAPKKETERHLRNLAGGKALIINPSDIAAKVVSANLFKDKR